MTVIALYRGTGFAGAWVKLARRWQTRDGHILQAQLPKECHPSSDPHAALLAPRFTSQVSHKGQDLTGY